MGYNSKEIKVISTAKETKDNPFEESTKKRKIITDPAGQWKHPGEITKIPSGNITMKGVNYPVRGVDNLGNEQMMYPGMDYTFPGDSVTEYPEMNKGGWLDDYCESMKKGGQHYLKSLTRNKTSKNIQSSLNLLMARNYEIHGLAGKRFYDPNAKFETGGTNWLDKYL